MEEGRQVVTRRRTPLSNTCAQPHHCPRPVRMKVLSRVPFLEDLSADQLDSIDERVVALSWAEGDPLFTEGASAEHLYVLATGRAKLVQSTQRGSEVVVDLLAPGDLFGGLPDVGNTVYAESAWSLTTTCALRIDRATFREILAEHPTVALRVLDDVAGKLARTRSEAGQRYGSTVAQRVARALLRLTDKFGQVSSGRSGTLIQLPLTRSDLAGMTGSTTESVSRVMSLLRKDGIIDSGRRWTAVLDRERLAATADRQY